MLPLGIKLSLSVKKRLLSQRNVQESQALLAFVLGLKFILVDQEGYCE